MRNSKILQSAFVLTLVILISRTALADIDGDVLRGPYLQRASDSEVTIRWRTKYARDAVVRFGTNAANLNRQANNFNVGKNHFVVIKGLSPNTRYYYSVGDNTDSFRPDTEQYFDTHPVSGSTSPTRIWVLGDSGTANAKAAAVRDAYVQYNGDSHADVWLMLGDNAYNDGTDVEYQNAVFDMYPQTLRNSILWSTLGNHDGHTADSDTQSGPYYNIFTFPKAGESGGLASGTEAYYSFDYGNIHFVSLDSYESARFPSLAMETWLENDLAATTQEWIIAFWHHPPYSKGSHDSDQEWRLRRMRETFLPILENHGVDLVLAGHSHSYERSMLINGHHGFSDTFDSVHVIDGGDGDPQGAGAYEKQPGGNSGAVFGVAGSSGLVQNAPLNHPVMVSNLVELGSMVIDVNDNQLDAVFINDSGVVRDSFRIVHGAGGPPPDTTVVEIGTGTLDSNRRDGPRWQRVNFDPLASGTHTISVAWDSDAEIRYSLFRSRDGQRIGKTDAVASPSTWTGELDANESYYLGIWSASGSADFSATIERAVTVIGQGTLDSTNGTASRYNRINFDSITDATHTISVTWDSDADIRFTVKDVDDTSFSPTVKMSSPGVWSGELQADQDYFIGLWSTEGIANFMVTIEASSSP